MLRRLSAQRDGYRVPPPSVPLTDEASFVSFINELNATWVKASQRLSPAVLTDLFTATASAHAAYLESIVLDDLPLYPVSWAGAEGHLGWLDIGREFTEQWHHQMQVRDSVNGAAPSDPAWLNAVLCVAMCGLPHAYRALAAAEGTTLEVVVTGEAGGTWSLMREGSEWVLMQGFGVAAASARCEMTADTAWRLLFNALPDAAAGVRCTGDTTLLTPLLRARSVVV